MGIPRTQISSAQCIKFTINRFRMKKKNNSVYGGLHLTATCHFEYDVLNSRCGVCLLAMLSLCLTAWLLFFTLIYSRYPDAIDDLLINQEISVVKTKPLNFAKNSVSGRREMSGVNVTFMGVGKNIEKHADSFLQQVEELSSMFYGSQAIFVVGTSNDDSAAKLKKWAKKSDHNRTILELDDEHLVDTVGKFLGLPLPREGRIAAARNTALNYYRQQQAHLTDYIINIDMDVIGWNLNGVQDSFGKKSQWDAVCANGVLLHGIYRDVYALRFPGMNTNHHLAGNDHEIYDIDSSQKDRNRNNLRVSEVHDRRCNPILLCDLD